MAASFGPVEASQKASAEGASVSYSSFDARGLDRVALLLVLGAIALFILWKVLG